MRLYLDTENTSLRRLRRRRDDTVTCASRVSTSIEEIVQWMAANRLVMNPAKTDVLWCSTSHQPSYSPLNLHYQA